MDDDADVRSVVEAVLSSAGFDALGAADGSEGIERAVLERPDLVLLDVLMPNLSGWEVCATLRSLPETSSIPVVMLTVKSEIRDFVAGRQAGAVDFVTKPFTKARLVEAVESALAGRDDARSGPIGSEMPERRTRGLLLDSLTGLPTIPVVVDALREKLLVDQDLGVLLVDVDAVASLEDHYGWELLDEVVREAAGGLRRLVGTLFSTSDLLAVSRPGSSALVAFVALPSGRGEEEIVGPPRPEGPAGRGISRGAPRRAVPRPRAPAARGHRGGLAADLQPTGPGRAARRTRPGGGGCRRLDAGGGAGRLAAGRVRRAPEATGHRDGLPADPGTFDRSRRGLGSALARAGGDRLREPGGPLRLRRAAWPGPAARGDLLSVSPRPVSGLTKPASSS